MNIRWVILTALLSLVVGAGAASWYWMDFWSRFVHTGLVLRAEADLVTKVAVLERLRAGKVEEAIRFQEILLDGDLIGAAALARDGTKFNANSRHAVELEAKARAAGGYQPDASIRDAVQEAFRLVPAAKNDSSKTPDLTLKPE